MIDPKDLELSVQRTSNAGYIMVPNWWEASPSMLERARTFFEENPTKVEMLIGSGFTRIIYTRRKRQQMAAAYGAGLINQGRIAGEYPPPPVEGPGTVTARLTHNEPSFREMRRNKWPKDYGTGVQRHALEDARKLADVSSEQAKAAMQKVIGVDWAELERRVLAWQAEMEKDLQAKGFRRAGDGPLGDSWIKDEEKPA
jgi:hypothetical protein